MFTWLESLPLWLQAIIILFTLTVTGSLIFMLLKGTLQAKFGKDGFSLYRNKKNGLVQDENLASNIFDVMLDYVKEVITLSDTKKTDKQMKYVENKLLLIKDVKEQNYYKLLKERGIPHDKLLSFEDSQFFREIINNMLNSDNGTKSTKRVIKEFIKDNDYLYKDGSEFDIYIDTVFSTIAKHWNDYMKFHYTSETDSLNSDKTIHSRKRLISNEEFYDYEKRNKLGEIRTYIKEIFVQAKAIQKEILEKETDLIAKRKKDLQDIFRRRE